MFDSFFTITCTFPLKRIWSTSDSWHRLDQYLSLLKTHHIHHTEPCVSNAHGRGYAVAWASPPPVTVTTQKQRNVLFHMYTLHTFIYRSAQGPMGLTPSTHTEAPPHPLDDHTWTRTLETTGGWLSPVSGHQNHRSIRLERALGSEHLSNYEGRNVSHTSSHRQNKVGHSPDI